MFEFKHARTQRFGRIAVFDRDRFLGDDRPVIVVFVDKMYGHSTFGRAGSDHGLVDPSTVHPLPAESRQERGVNVQDSISVPLQGSRSKFFHIPGQKNQIHPSFVKSPFNGPVERDGIGMGPAAEMDRVDLVIHGASERT